MSSSSRPPVDVEAATTGAATPAGFAQLAPEVQGQMYSRLGGTGLLYAGGWITTYIFYRFFGPNVDHEPHEQFWNIISTICIAAGLGIYFLCRARRIAPRAFANFAVAFEVLGGVGIYAGAYRWLEHGELMLIRVAEAFGLPTADLGASVVQPLSESGARILYSEGVTWVGVWLLVFPLVVPMPMRRTIVATLLTAATVPAILLVSAAVQGVPPALEPWVLPYVLETSVPTFICAGMAIYGSSVVFRLAQDLSRARRMGNYQLVEQIGTGGMGEVWRAQHRMLARPAAIKLIRADVLARDPAQARLALKRFEREVQLTTQLSHPNTITIFDYGRTPDGVFYYVMEFLDGIDLETMVTRFGPVPAPRVIHWLRQACGSLNEAHARGLIHRDIKPANLYACRQGLLTDFLKVLDFGLVKGERAREIDDTRMTAEHTTVGTPSYMPPEIALGEEADARSDLYALGCVAYWLLTGLTVFDGDTPMRQAVQHASEAPVPPSRRTELRVPPDLEAIVLTCLEKKRSDRPADARELEARLARCDGARDWTAESSDRWWRAHLPESAVEELPPTQP